MSSRRAIGAVVLAAAATTTAARANCTQLALVPVAFGSAMRQNPLGTCSGAGHCEEERCLCEAGWSGKADFWDLDGLDCVTYEPALRGLWGVALVAVLLASARSAPIVWRRFKRHWKQQCMQAFLDNRCLLASLMLVVVCLPSVAAMAMLHLAGAQLRIGLNAAPTVLYSLMHGSFQSALWLFQPALLVALLKGEANKNETRKLIWANDSLSRAIGLLTLVNMALPFAALVNSKGQDQGGLAIFLAFVWTSLVQQLLVFVQAVLMRRQIVDVLSKSCTVFKSERTESMRFRLGSVESTLIAYAVAQAVVYSILALYPFLWSKHNYILPLQCLGMALVFSRIAFCSIRSAGCNSSYATDDSSHCSARTRTDSSPIWARSMSVGTMDSFGLGRSSKSLVGWSLHDLPAEQDLAGLDFPADPEDFVDLEERPKPHDELDCEDETQDNSDSDDEANDNSGHTCEDDVVGDLVDEIVEGDSDSD